MPKTATDLFLKLPKYYMIASWPPTTSQVWIMAPTFCIEHTKFWLLAPYTLCSVITEGRKFLLIDKTKMRPVGKKCSKIQTWEMVYGLRRPGARSNSVLAEDWRLPRGKENNVLMFFKSMKMYRFIYTYSHLNKFTSNR